MSILEQGLFTFLFTFLLFSIAGDGRTETEWAKEGRRIIPLLRRATPITATTPIGKFLFGKGKCKQMLHVDVF